MLLGFRKVTSPPLAFPFMKYTRDHFTVYLNEYMELKRTGLSLLWSVGRAGVVWRIEEGRERRKRKSCRGRKYSIWVGNGKTVIN